jgi:putative FmdB family regulatory protein
MTHHWHSETGSARDQEGDVPTYQYACTACGHQLEAVQSFSDAPLIECPECAGRLRKLFSSVGIVFKGSGFYRNDSRSDAKSSDKPAEKSAEKTAEKKEAPATTSGTDSSKSSTPAKSTAPAPAAAA